VDRAELIERTWSALEVLGIRELAEREPGRLSGGQQQLVAIASILAMRPRHLILDEPTAQLDPAGTALVAAAIERLASAGTSILVVEHKADLLARVAARVVVLGEGRLVIEGPAATVLADPRLPGLGVAPPAHVRLVERLETTHTASPIVLAAVRAATADGIAGDLSAAGRPGGPAAAEAASS
jgi:energy-coupling factor transporter ATP-binding protein EcfA2